VSLSLSVRHTPWEVLTDAAQPNQRIQLDHDVRETPSIAPSSRRIAMLTPLYRSDGSAGFSTAQKDAATQLIWPLFANTVTTVQDWAQGLGEAKL
jgi:hypothetical protein